MPAYPRCGPLLRDGQLCKRTVAPGRSVPRQSQQAAGDCRCREMRQGRTPKARANQQPLLRLIAAPEQAATTGTVTIANADPASIGPSLAVAAAELGAGVDHGPRRSSGRWRALSDRRRPTHAIMPTHTVAQRYAQTRAVAVRHMRSATQAVPVAERHRARPVMFATPADLRVTRWWQRGCVGEIRSG